MSSSLHVTARDSRHLVSSTFVSCSGDDFDDLAYELEQLEGELLNQSLGPRIGGSGIVNSELPSAALVAFGVLRSLSYTAKLHLAV